MARQIVLDLETKKIFDEVPGGKHSLLGVSVVGIWDSTDKKLKTFFENQLGELFKILEDSELVVGYNIKKFDFPVLSPYYPGNLEKIPTLDLMDVVKEKIGFRLKLDDLAFATLGRRKSGDGLGAVKFFREGKLEDLAKYCLDDVVLTRDLYHFARDNGHLKFYDLGQVLKVIEVNLEKYLPKVGSQKTQMSLGV